MKGKKSVQIQDLQIYFGKYPAMFWKTGSFMAKIFSGWPSYIHTEVIYSAYFLKSYVQTAKFLSLQKC